MGPSSKECSIASTSTTASNFPLKAKVILLGDHGVGKSTFLRHIIKEEGTNSRPLWKVRNPFTSSGCVKSMTFGDRKVDVILQDTAGQERYRSLTSSYYRGINACLLFYNVHIQSSFDNLTNWLDDMSLYTDKRPAIVLIGITTRLYNTKPISREPKLTDSNANKRNIQRLRNSFRRRKLDLVPETQTQDKPLRELYPSLGSSHSLPYSARASLNDDINLVGTNSQNNNNSKINNSQYTVKNTHTNFDLAATSSSLLSKTTSMPSLNYNTLPQANTSFPSYRQKHGRSYDNVNGSYVNQNFDNDEATEETLNEDRGYCCERVVSEQQAKNFAYEHELSYREMDLDCDYSVIENILDRVVQATFDRDRRNSFFGENSGIVMLKPSNKGHHESQDKRCCSCLC